MCQVINYMIHISLTKHLWLKAGSKSTVFHSFHRISTMKAVMQKIMPVLNMVICLEHNVSPHDWTHFPEISSVSDDLNHLNFPIAISIRNVLGSGTSGSDVRISVYIISLMPCTFST